MKQFVLVQPYKDIDEIKLVLRHIDKKEFFFGVWTYSLLRSSDGKYSKILTGTEEEMKTLSEYLQKENDISTQVCHFAKKYPKMFMEYRQLEVQENNK